MSVCTKTAMKREQEEEVKEIERNQNNKNYNTEKLTYPNHSKLM